MMCPPSIYAPSVALSDSLLNTTSVSKNGSPQAKKQKIQKVGSGITSNKYPENTVFM